ncbi:ABC transporter ATP-binding protein [Candidatus Nomurabacteria bacterium]|nr:ABC transporter ATP-binding protein [Candidatus Nomurabacteria bacterium]MCB9819554.1 ABC transporter ATP-binding protein [Candidatus Nomurabacteria bacterium]
MQTKDIRQTENQAIPQTPFAFFWYVSKPFKWWMVTVIFVVVVASIISQGAVYFFKLIIDAVEVGDTQAALKYALLYPVAVFIGETIFRLSGYAGSKWVVGVKKYSYDVLSKYILRHSHSYFSNRFAGSLLSKINNINSAFDSLIPDFLWSHLTAIMSLLITMGFLMMVDPKSTLIFLVLVIVLFIYNNRLAKTKSLYSMESAEAATVYRARLIDVITNVQAVRQYVNFSLEEERMKELSSDLYLKNRRSWMYSEATRLWNGVILLVFALIMFWVLLNEWKQGSVSTGDLVLVMALYSQITGMLVFIGRAFNETAKGIGEIKEGLNELSVPIEIIDAREAPTLLTDGATIAWKQVRFRFEGQPVFTDFDLNIPRGQRLGLVGRSGAGKSTFVSLMLRQHDITAGSIEIDGQDISKVTQDSLRQNIAVVPQEPALFHRSIRENIAYGKPSATEEELIEVAKKAQAYDFIMSLPEGFETMVGERGVKLSGGQKQRVAIARAMLKDAPILVLDEATSALDSESEVAIQKALETLMEGRTVIAIAHRLSTLRKMDRIIVMENGKIIEDGEHNKLSKAGGTYERLWNHQAGGFVLED